MSLNFTDIIYLGKAVPGSGGGGGGDQHNLGWYATQSALETAHPTANDGDWAIVGSTDTVWVWDTDTSAWVDSDQKGQVTSVNGQTGAVTVDALPSQTGQSGKFLTTDGTDASWSDKPLVNTATGTSAIAVGTNMNASGSWSVAIGFASAAYGTYSTAVGYNTHATGVGSIALGKNAQCNGEAGVGIGGGASASHAIQLGSTTALYTTNSDANTFKVGNANGNFEIMSADGTIPTDRFTTTPVADGTYYPTLSIASGVATRSWGAIDALPSQTGHSGEVLTTNGTAASWTTPTTITFRTWGANE